MLKINEILRENIRKNMTTKNYIFHSKLYDNIKDLYKIIKESLIESKKTIKGANMKLEKVTDIREGQIWKLKNGDDMYVILYPIGSRSDIFDISWVAGLILDDGHIETGVFCKYKDKMDGWELVGQIGITHKFEDENNERVIEIPRQEQGAENKKIISL